MSNGGPITLASRPRLASFARLQHDAARDRWVLQAPERVFVLDETGKEILERCTGELTVGGVIDALCAEFDAPRDVIEHDVLAVLRLMVDKTFVIVDDDTDPG